jgi:hypothetical protein
VVDLRSPFLDNFLGQLLHTPEEPDSHKTWRMEQISESEDWHKRNEYVSEGGDCDPAEYGEEDSAVGIVEIYEKAGEEKEEGTLYEDP